MYKYFDKTGRNLGPCYRPQQQLLIYSQATTNIDLDYFYWLRDYRKIYSIEFAIYLQLYKIDSHPFDRIHVDVQSNSAQSISEGC